MSVTEGTASDGRHDHQASDLNGGGSIVRVRAYRIGSNPGRRVTSSFGLEPHPSHQHWGERQHRHRPEGLLILPNKFHLGVQS